METKDLKFLVEEAKKRREDLDVLIRSYKERLETKNQTNEEIIANYASFHELNKLKKEVEAHVTQVVRLVWSEYKGDKREQLQLMVEQYEKAYQVFVVLLDESNNSNYESKKVKNYLDKRTKALDKELYRLWDEITTEFLL